MRRKLGHLCSLRQVAKKAGKCRIAVLGGVLIAEYHLGARMTDPGHDLLGGRALDRQPGGAGMTEIVEMQFRAANGRTRRVPGSIQARRAQAIFGA